MAPAHRVSRRKPIAFADRVSCTLDDAVVATGIGKSKLYSLMKTGILKYRQLGSRRMLDVSSVIALVRPNTETAALPRTRKRRSASSIAQIATPVPETAVTTARTSEAPKSTAGVST